MPKPKDTLERININTPCTADWDEMVGNDQVRFCKHCNLSVHNLSAMTKQEALRIVMRSNGKLCARYIRRPDGAIHTTDLVLPRLHSITRRASRFAAGAFSAALSLSTSAVTAAPARSNTTDPAASVHVTKGANSNPVVKTDGSSVKGVVKDQNGLGIVGATVTLRNDAGNLTITTTTDDDGVFVLQTIEIGTFTLKIEAPGFAAKDVPNINLQPNGEMTFDETLEVREGEMFTVGGATLIVPSNPLVAAVVEGNMDGVKELLATGTDVNVVDDELDSTALSQAVANGNREIVDLLINAGADLNKRSRTGHTALMTMTGSTTAEIVWALIDAGAKTDLRDDDGRFALHYAASNTNPEALRALVDGGASVDARDESDQTALMIASDSGNTDNVRVLLKAGATVNLRDEDGNTALGLALEDDNEEAAEVLKEFGAVE